MQNGDPNQCPFCDTEIPTYASVDIDELQFFTGYHRVKHLLSHALKESQGVSIEDINDVDLSNDCDVREASDWEQAACQARFCIEGSFGDTIEASCKMALALSGEGKLGRRPDNWSNQRATLTWARNLLYSWFSGRFP
ncbi:MAG: hypothetical protein QE272_12150 [Nevskia sp.]|nr:hypothetical protein [Nevskia sp.]